MAVQRVNSASILSSMPTNEGLEEIFIFDFYYNTSALYKKKIKKCNEYKKQKYLVSNIIVLRFLIFMKP